MRIAAVLALLALWCMAGSSSGSITRQGRRLSATDVDRVAEKCCSAHLTSSADSADNATELEATTQCCVTAVRLALPLRQRCPSRLLTFGVAMDVVHCVDAELHRSGRQFNDFACCMSVYKLGIAEEEHHCLHQCEAAYTTATAKPAFLAAVKSCRLHNPVFPCFEECIAEGDDNFHAPTCLVKHLPDELQLWDE